MPEEREAPHFATRGLLLTLIVFSGSLGFFQLLNRDLGLHITAGQYTFQHWLPETNVFSAVNDDFPLVQHEWIFQLLTYGLESLLGLSALVGFRVLVVMGIAWLMWRAVAGRGHPALSALTIALGLFVSHERFVFRPEILTLLFTAIFLWLLIDFVEGRGDRLNWLPVLTVIWANIHAYFFVGHVVIGCLAAGEILSALKNAKARPRAKRLVIIGIASALASLLNPYLHEGALYPYLLFFQFSAGETFYASTIAELRPPWSYLFQDIWPMRAAYPLLGLFALSTILQGSKIRVGYLLIGLAAIFMFHAAFRNIGLLGVLLGTVTAVQWTHVRLGRPFFAKLSPFGTYTSSAAALLLVFATFMMLTNRVYANQESERRVGTGALKNPLTPESRLFVKENIPDVPVFNNFNIGSSFLWWFYPDKRPFVDGNAIGYPQEFYEKVYLTSQLRRPLAPTLEEYGIEWAYLELNIPLAAELFHNEDWAPVFLDPTAVVLVRKNERFASLIESVDLKAQLQKREIPAWTRTKESSFLQKRFPHDELKLGNFLRNTGYLDAAQDVFEHASRVAPWSPRPWLSLGGIYADRGDWKTATSQILRAVAADDGCADAHAQMAVVRLQTGQGALATQSAERAVDLQRDNPSHWTMLASVHDATGRSRDAVEAARQAVELQARNHQLHQFLGNLLLKIGDRRGARKHFETSLELAPDQPGAEELRKTVQALSAQ